jgi:hypothetical protein
MLATLRAELRKPGRAWALLIALWIFTAIFMGWIYSAVWVGATIVLGLIRKIRTRSRAL